MDRRGFIGAGLATTAWLLLPAGLLQARPAKGWHRPNGRYHQYFNKVPVTITPMQTTIRYEIDAKLAIRREDIGLPIWVQPKSYMFSADSPFDAFAGLEQQIEDDIIQQCHMLTDTKPGDKVMFEFAQAATHGLVMPIWILPTTVHDPTKIKPYIAHCMAGPCILSRKCVRAISVK